MREATTKNGGIKSRICLSLSISQTSEKLPNIEYSASVYLALKLKLFSNCVESPALQNPRPLLRSWDRAALQPAPDAIPPARNQPVEWIAEKAGNPPQYGGHSGPRPGQLPKQCQRSRESSQYLLLSHERMAKDQHRAGSAAGLKQIGVPRQ